MRRKKQKETDLTSIVQAGQMGFSEHTVWETKRSLENLGRDLLHVDLYNGGVYPGSQEQC